MRTLLPIGSETYGTVGAAAVNIVPGGSIGGIILLLQLAAAVWYPPLTIYRPTPDLILEG